MFSSIRNLWKIPDLRNKILFTLFILTLYRLGSYVPVPGIDQEAVKRIQEQAEQGGVLSFLQLFAGKALTQYALFALGIMPYITSSIIMQILTVVIPKLEQWQQQGAVGQKKITQWTRYVTIAIAVLQSTSFVYLFHNGGGGLSTNNHGAQPATDCGVEGCQRFESGDHNHQACGHGITQRGIGNGMSLLIFSSVVAGLPGVLGAVKATKGWGWVAFILMMFVLLLVFVIYIENGQRRIPVQFAKRQVGRRMYGGQSTYIPLKVNQAGVVPIIFASAFLNLPVLLSQVFPSDG